MDRRQGLLLDIIKYIIQFVLDFYRRSWPVFLTLSLGLFIAGFNVKPVAWLFILAGIFFIISIVFIILDIKKCREKDKDKYTYSKY